MPQWTDSNGQQKSTSLNEQTKQYDIEAPQRVATSTPSPRTAPQHTNAAAQIASQQLHLDDEKWLLAALTEIATEEVSRNPSFALRVRNRYDELRPAKKAAAPRTSRSITGGNGRKKSAMPEEPLIPIKQLPWRHIDIEQELDPYFILEYYGAHQLEAALRQQPLARLKEAVALVQQRHPGTKPHGRLSIASAIAYITEHAMSSD